MLRQGVVARGCFCAVLWCCAWHGPWGCQAEFVAEEGGPHEGGTSLGSKAVCGELKRAMAKEVGGFCVCCLFSKGKGVGFLGDEGDVVGVWEFTGQVNQFLVLGALSAMTVGLNAWHSVIAA